jgi:pyruvate/2-oxoglutarate dehydrogenase complex dihydrolipoamide dehydrogenase (E3) component
MSRNEPPLPDFPVGRHDADILRSVRPSGWRNPEPARRYNLVVIGAGPAGLVAARGAAAFGAKVALIERNLVGGDCLNVGCVPSKALIRSSRLYADMRNAEDFGVKPPAEVDVDFTLAMDRMRRLRARIAEADSVARLTEAGIDVFFGQAQFTGPDRIAVAGAELRFAKALIATGAHAKLPEIPGLMEAGYLSNETVFNLTHRPDRLLVIGGGPLGCEMAQTFCRMGTKVILAQDEPMFLPREERDAAQILSDSLARDGVEIHLNTSVVAVRMADGQKFADLVREGDTTTVNVDQILTGIGRAPSLDGLNLAAAEVEADADGVKVDDFMRTTNRRIYAAGDVCLDHKFTHTAEATARIALQNALFLGRKRLSTLVIPWCTYTDPEIAHVGLYPFDARKAGLPVRTFTIMMHDVDRAVTDGMAEGFVKIHVRQNSDRILGATVVARHAGDMINGISLAIGSGMGLGALADVIHAYPTQAAAIKMAGDAYERSRLTPLLKRLAACWLRLVR